MENLETPKAVSLFSRISFWHYLLLLIPIAVLAPYYNLNTIIIFTLATTVLVPLAYFLSKATEVLSEKIGEHFSGIINITFGNTAELAIAILAIRSGLTDIVKYTLIGAIIGKILFVLGLSIFVGGTKFGKLELNPDITSRAIVHLAMAAMCFGVPSIFARQGTSVIINKYSVSIAVVLLMVYFVGMTYTVMNRENKEASRVIQDAFEATAPNWGIATSLSVLILTTGGIVYFSGVLVNQIKPFIAYTHIPSDFVGLIILPLIGNVAEHSVATASAVKNKINLSLTIAVESSTQIALFVSPVCVLIAGLFGQNFNLIFNKIELITLGMSIGGTWLVIQDNKSNWWEGFSLLSFYIIIAITAYFL